VTANSQKQWDDHVDGQRHQTAIEKQTSTASQSDDSDDDDMSLASKTYLQRVSPHFGYLIFTYFNSKLLDRMGVTNAEFALILHAMVSFR